MKISYLPNILLSFYFLLLFSGCETDSPFGFDRNENPAEDSLPVEFIVFGPEEDTRSSETQKLRFQENDVIHIQADFIHNDKTTSRQYGAMVLAAGKWISVDGSFLAWPSNAVKGKFKAYYMPQADGVLQAGIPTDAVLLSKLDASHTDNKRGYDIDPLYADTYTNIPEGYDYGHAVELHFTHACSHLTFVNMDTGVSDYFWLVNIDKKSTLNNAYRLMLDDQNQLKIEFVKSEASTYGKYLSYVSAKASIDENPEGEGIYERRVKVSFFLEPGDYSNIELRTNNNSPYLSFKSDETEDLQPHTPYIIDAVKSKGISYTINEDDPWDYPRGEYEVVVKEFIEAIVNGDSYTVTDSLGNEIGILEPIPNGVELLQSVRFPDEGQEEYDKYEGWNPNRSNSFSPNIPSGRVFEGNYHYISNIKQPLFQYNAGTIQNLGLKDIDCEVISEYVGQDNDYKADRSRRGALCQWNRVGGVIQNIRIENLSLTVKVEKGLNTITHSAGGVCGENRGTISDIALSGDIQVTIKNNSNKNVDSEIPFGGIVGQNTGVVSGIAPLDNSQLPFNMRVINLCTGDGGVFSVGGAVGFSGNIIENISIPNITVDCSLSDGYQGYTGGIVGRLRGSDTSNLVRGCTVSGSVSAGIVSDYGDMTDSYLYTGGLVGSCAFFEVSDCATTCRVSGLKTGETPQENSRYATGGVFGTILIVDGEDKNIINNITGWNDSVNGPKEEASNDTNDNGAYMGIFAGIVPQGRSWDYYSGKGVSVKSLPGMGNIGESMNVAAGGAPVIND